MEFLIFADELQFLWRWTTSTMTKEKVPKERASQNPKAKDGGALAAMV